WTFSDPSGVSGYAVVLDQAAGTVPAASVTQTGTSFNSPVTDDTSYFQLRATDGGAGWGAASTFTVNVDTTGLLPSIGSSAHQSQLRWYATTPPSASWTFTDPSGGSGYAVVLDQAAGTVPAASVTQTGTSYTSSPLADGTWYLHVRAKDGAGNW